MRKIDVNLKERAYDVVIMPGLLDDLYVKIESFAKNRKVLIITDSNVNQLYGEKVLNTLKEVCSEADIAVFPAGEPSKTLATVEALYTRGVDFGLDRSSAVVALGGGVVGDIAGFLPPRI